jgi:hypothetical protein
VRATRANTRSATPHTHFQICDVTGPHLVGCLELYVELLLRYRGVVVLHARARVADRGYASLDAVRSHEARYAVIANAVTIALGHLVHPRATVGTAAFCVNRLDPRHQRLILALAFACIA